MTAHLTQSLCEPRGAYSYVLLPRESDKVRRKEMRYGGDRGNLPGEYQRCPLNTEEHAKEQTHKYIFFIVIVFIITCRCAPMTMGMRVPGCACRDQRAASGIS